MRAWRPLPGISKVFPVKVLRNRNFSLLWRGQTISLCGNQAFFIAVTFLLKEATDSATEMAKWMALVSLPGLFLGVFAGAVVDRNPRIRVVVACNLLAGMVSLVLGFGGMFYEGLMSLGFVLSAAAVMGAIRSFFMPAFQAAIPELVPDEQLKSANSLFRSSAKVSDSGGQILSGLFYSSFMGSSLLFICDGLSYVFAGFTAKMIDPPESESSKNYSRKGADAEILRETKEALLYLKDRKGMRDLLVVSCALNFISSPVIFLLPFYVSAGLIGEPVSSFSATPESDSARYGILMATMGFGAVLGHLLVSAELFKGKPLGWILSFGLVLGHLFLAAIGFVSSFWMAAALSFASSVTLGVVMVYLITLYQDTIQKELRGRIFSLSRTLGEGLLPIGIYLGGRLYDLTNKSFPLIFGGVGILSALASLGLFRSECRKFLAQAREI